MVTVTIIFKSGGDKSRSSDTKLRLWALVPVWLIDHMTTCATGLQCHVRWRVANKLCSVCRLHSLMWCTPFFRKRTHRTHSVNSQSIFRNCPIPSAHPPHVPRTRTTRYRSFIHHRLIHYQPKSKLKWIFSSFIVCILSVINCSFYFVVLVSLIRVFVIEYSLNSISDLVCFPMCIVVVLLGPDLQNILRFTIYRKIIISLS